MPSTPRPPPSSGEGSAGADDHPILIVDDEPTLLELIRDVLEDEGYRVLTATNGAAALYLVQHAHVALVLTDYMMPSLSGLELAHRLRSRPETAAIPLILMSAALPSRHSDVFAAVIRKPFPIDTLVQIVRQHAAP